MIVKRFFPLLTMILPFVETEAQTKPEKTAGQPATSASAFALSPPDKLYGELFRDVQMNKIFPDSKTFVDCVPRRDPARIVKDYMAAKRNPNLRFSLRLFVEENFILPTDPASAYHSEKGQDVVAHIENLWSVLRRSKDQVTGGSRLPLPHPYIVPGGRFREIYYWDSYFTMLGLQESGQWDIIRNMIDNFAYLIRTYGHIPNGNRTYYLSRSQPPFFALMVELLAEKEGETVYQKYQKELQREYDYWMDKTAKTRHVVRMPDGSVLNRFYDRDDIPRQESFSEDSTLAQRSRQNRAALYRNLRSGAESGWDFSSRWFADGQTLATIRTTDLIPVDLNGLLYRLELTLARSYALSKQQARSTQLKQAAGKRMAALETYCWNDKEGWYFDYDIANKRQSTEKTLAGFTPFFFGTASRQHIDAATKTLQRDFLKPGGVVTTLKNTGQQWDAPNGWAPLQWMTIDGLEQYGKHEQAIDLAGRWAALNVRVYKKTGKLMEKYNVIDQTLEAGGGEYPSQDGFGWTNGVLLKIIRKYKINE